MGLKWLKEFISDGPKESPHIPTKEEYWEERKNDPDRTHTELLPSDYLTKEEQKKVVEAISMAYKIVYGGINNPLIEINPEVGPSIRFKVRKAFNLSLKSDPQAMYNLLKVVRREINIIKKFRTCKVFMLVYESEPEMTSLNIVYNPHWRRHEGYEIMYRTPTQLRRSRR